MHRRRTLRTVAACSFALAFAACSAGPARLGSTVSQAFGRGEISFHPTAFAPYTFENTIVRIRFNFARGIVDGNETAIVHAKRAGLQNLPFNTLGIHYTRVTVNGQRATYSFDNREQRIDVALPTAVGAGTRLVVAFTYWAAPQAGIYFIRPDKSYPRIAPEIWSQGETTDNRRWFPTWDEPNQKTPSELIVTVPHGWTVIANGYLKAHTESRRTDTWDWNSPRIKSTYLIAFAAGPLSESHTTLGSLNVDSYVQPRNAKLNAICFGRTNQMIDYYQRIIGMKYPFEKYDQITAERFTFGGMENASATIQTALALHPANQDIEDSCDGLVSHELAQQWWGDDVTMADWSNAWINEGFATYFDELWRGERFGAPEFEYQRYRAQRAYFAETRDYFRPIVDYNYNNPLDLFDASGHQRPAQALHMLRYMFGDARFFAALHNYLREYQYRNANTHQFFTAIGASLGTDLTWFETEWFYRSAYPHYDVSDTYDQAARVLTLHITQKSHDGKPFRMPVVIEAFAGGRTIRVRPTIENNDQVVTMTGVPSRPVMVLFDPNNNILRKLTFPKSLADLAYQLINARHVGDREWALRQLGALSNAPKTPHDAAMRAIRKAVLFDPFYGVRMDAVAIAARFDDATSVAAALDDKDVRVRIAAENAAGELKGQPAAVVDRLNALTNDADANVAAAALASLGSLRAPGIYARLVGSLNRPSFRQTIASGALRGLARYGNAAALPLIERRTRYGTQEEERNVAVNMLAQLARRTKEPQMALPTLLGLVTHDPLIGTRMAAADALGLLGDTAAIPALERVERSDSQLLVRIEAWSAIAAIR
ncbi:MAG TPA: M1 family aminopeptidase [Candidatus Baltobacteraceae bacterium]|nr:M1 family aminopeptidase [Candidatus Baltobacteraceae bacterium]